MYIYIYIYTCVYVYIYIYIYIHIVYSSEQVLPGFVVSANLRNTFGHFAWGELISSANLRNDPQNFRNKREDKMSKSWLAKLPSAS